MFAVRQEADKVIIDLNGRRYDILMTCPQAEEFAYHLEQAASAADLHPKSLVAGEQWGANVESYDGKVAIRFYPPHVGAPERVPLPAAAARKLAKVVREKESWARHKMRLVLKQNGGD
jgi:hypothetical protein